MTIRCVRAVLLLCILGAAGAAPTSGVAGREGSTPMTGQTNLGCRRQFVDLVCVRARDPLGLERRRDAATVE